MRADCHQFCLNGGFTVLHQAGDMFINWLTYMPHHQQERLRTLDIMTLYAANQVLSGEATSLSYYV